MKKVITYIRVSTDEQADKGYSQRHQDEMLDRYCEINNHQVLATYIEDHSAKTFDRPEFNKLLVTILKSKTRLVDTIMFTKWDRFSRNAGDAYQMIARLRKAGVEVMAIEQPLDLSIPENKMMLAFYLAAPEVENDRRALNVSNGMLRAKKEGRYMGKAPIGYSNVFLAGRKAIAPNDRAAEIRWIFKTIAEAKYSSESVLKKLREKGFVCSKNNFWNILGNQVYCGFVRVPAYNGQPAYLHKGTHEALITPDLFYNVQDILHGRKKKQREKLKLDDNFPMRGHLRCINDGKTLTASSSRGKMKKLYSYYHCISSCGKRFRSDLAHRKFISILQDLKPHPAIKFLLKNVVEDFEQQQKVAGRQAIARIKKELIEIKDRKEKTLNLLIAGSIAADDYQLIKNQCEQQNFKLEAELTQISMQNHLEDHLNKCMEVLERLPELYEKADAFGKRKILSSILEEKMEFTGHEYRTPHFNEAVMLVFNLHKGFSEIIKGQGTEVCDLSHEVNWLGLEPRAHTLKVYCSTN